MKTIFKYISALMLFLIVFSGCEEGNDNWTIIKDVQPGTYITGDATIYSAVATSSALVPAALDNAPEGTDVIGIYTWLKANAKFTILQVNEKGEQVTYGKGDVVASTPFETTNLAAGAEGYSVDQDGLYYVVLNNADKQLTLIPAAFGIIGDATPGSWSTETILNEVAFNQNQATVELTLQNVALDKKQIKFRYKDWGIEIPYAGAKVKFHSNLGNNAESVAPLNAAFAECKGGGQNFSISTKGLYTVTLKLDLRTGLFTAKAVLTGEDTATAELPEHMFVTGSPAAWNWQWNNVPELTPVHSHDGMFWGIYYLNANDQLTFNNELSWDNGDNFGIDAEDAKDYGEYNGGSKNLTVKNSGYHLVVVTCTLSDDKKSVVRKVAISQPRLYVLGDCGMGWSSYDEAWKFTENNGVFTSPAVKTGNLHLCVRLTDDWGAGNSWQSEFNVFSGKIEFRGKGGDQSAVPATAGQIVKLDFRTNTGSIE